MLNGREVSIVLPWGNIAGKVWGLANDEPVLCIHGMNDNCASFDRLIPLLVNTSKYFLAIDLPGHGRSDHYPPTAEVSILNYVTDMKRICQQLKWKNLSILAHSQGSLCTLYFASLFPEMINSLILIDALHLIEVIFEPKDIPLLIVHSINERIRYENERQEDTLFTWEEAVTKISKYRISEIDNDKLKGIVKRSTTDMGDKFFFHTDKRIKRIIEPYITKDIHSSLLSNIRSPTLIVMSEKGLNLLERFKSCKFTFDILKMTLNRKLIIKHTSGSHDVHIENPELVAPYIVKFLACPNAKL